MGAVSAILPGLMNGFLIAIDGPAGSGKSSVARAVAERLGFSDVNTGAAYRAVAFLALREDLDPDNEEALASAAGRIRLEGDGVVVDGEPVPDEALRSPEVSASASKVSASPRVRSVLLAAQREAAERAREEEGGAVVEGRDIGTIVLPDAELKIFLSAAPEERARRRARQSGREAELERIREAMKTRDRRDTERETAPLKPAPDARIIDTTELGLEEVVERILALASAFDPKRGS